jgi:hypothetical protein
MGIPSFLRPEHVPYASITRIPASSVPFLARPSTTALLDAMLADNARVDRERAEQAPVVDVAIVPVPDQPAGPVVDVALIRQPDLAKPAQAEKWYAANCPSWRKGGKGGAQ